MSDANRQADITNVAAWLDDLAARQTAIERISALGTYAIEPLACYLNRGPQLVSQARVLAVEMLGRLHDPRVANLLRDVLYTHPLKQLSPALAESEFRVKNAAVQALVEKQHAASNRDIAWAIQSERLPAAVHAAGILKLTGLAPSLVDLLTDDVLAGWAETALLALLPNSVSSLHDAIQTWLHSPTDTPRTRLALIRAFCCLAEAGATGTKELIGQGLMHASPLVRSAAALAARDTIHTQVISALIHGALSNAPTLGIACQDRLQSLGMGLIEPALEALHENRVTDVYGNVHHSDILARYALVTRLLQLTRHDPVRLSQVVAVVSVDDLVMALQRWMTPSIASLQALMSYPDAHVRVAAATAAERLNPAESIRWLSNRLNDKDRHVRREAYVSLLHHIDIRRVQMSLKDIPLSAWGLSPFKCIHLLARSLHR